MPTLRAYWEGLDIELRERLNLYPSAEMLAQVRRERAEDRLALLAALQAQGLMPTVAAPQAPAAKSSAPKSSAPLVNAAGGGFPLPVPFTPELAQALHLFLARSSAGLAAIQIDDLLGLMEPVNVPGTSVEYPNWQRKLNSDLEQIAARSDLAERLRAINRMRATVVRALGA
jgi:4-alpha-glucanotransferase